MRRGDVWWAQLPVPAGRRPVVLVSRNAAYEQRALVTVVEVTTRVRGHDAEVSLGPREGLPRRCVANADAIRTIPKGWLTERIALLGVEKVRALDAALLVALGLEEAMR
jgi:mRNA interferase MazF